MNSGTSYMVDCVDDCFVMQYNQIFIGMITMQYQAKQVSSSSSCCSCCCSYCFIIQCD